MKRIARIALFVVLLIGGMVRLGWCQEYAEQRYKKDLQHIQGLLEAANRYDQGFYGDRSSRWQSRLTGAGRRHLGGYADHRCGSGCSDTDPAAVAYP